MDQFEDQFLAENPDALGLAFEEEAKFFDPEAAHEAEAAITRNPLIAIAIAVGLGFLLGVLTRR